MTWLALYLYAVGAVFSYGSSVAVAQIAGQKFRRCRAAALAIVWPVSFPAFVVMGRFS